MYSASRINVLDGKLDDFRATYSSDMKELKEFFVKFQTPQEQRLRKAIGPDCGQGESKNVSDEYLQKLLSISEGKPANSGDITSKNENKALAILREEVKEDLEQLLIANREVFGRKLRSQTNVIVAEIESQSDRIISTVMAGPHERVVDPVRRYRAHAKRDTNSNNARFCKKLGEKWYVRFVTVLLFAIA